MGYSWWGCRESDTTERLTLAFWTSFASPRSFSLPFSCGIIHTEFRFLKLKPRKEDVFRQILVLPCDLHPLAKGICGNDFLELEGQNLGTKRNGTQGVVLPRGSAYRLEGWSFSQRLPNRGPFFLTPLSVTVHWDLGQFREC